MGSSLYSHHYFPPFWKEWLAEEYHALMDGVNKSNPITEAIRQLHQFYLQQETTNIHSHFGYTSSFVTGYTLYFMPINMLKAWSIWDRVGCFLPSLANYSSLRILDIGCGPGTLTWAWIFYLYSRCPQFLEKPIELILVDQSQEFLDQFLSLWRRLLYWISPLRSWKVTTHCHHWLDAFHDPFDYIMLGNLLCESQTNLSVENLLQGRFWLIIEPGTPRAFECIRILRNQIIQKEAIRILFPCPQTITQCPMPSSNWCHFAINRLTHPVLQQLTSQLRCKAYRHHFCGLFLDTQPLSKATTTLHNESSYPQQFTWRLLSPCKRYHRHILCWLCNGEVVREIILNRREKSENNRILSRARWGDLLRIYPSDNHLTRILRETQIQLVF